MNTKIKTIVCATISIAVAFTLLTGCEDSSDSIPNNDQGAGWLGIEELMIAGWDAYNAGNFEEAQQQFRDANQRNALYLPAYDGLGWSAVRLGDFLDAAIQFSFITTEADPATEGILLADAYAGLSLSAVIERMTLQNNGEGSIEEYEALMVESIEMAEMVFGLMGEDYIPDGHDLSFGSEALHLMNAQNYFYLQEFGNSEEELSVVDPDFVADQVEAYKADVVGELIEIPETTAFPDMASLSPANPAIHHITEIIAPDPAWVFTYEVSFGVNDFDVIPADGTELTGGDEFTVSYSYITDLPQYLDELIEHISSLINI